MRQVTFFLKKNIDIMLYILLLVYMVSLFLPIKLYRSIFYAILIVFVSRVYIRGWSWQPEFNNYCVVIGVWITFICFSIFFNEGTYDNLCDFMKIVSRHFGVLLLLLIAGLGKKKCENILFIGMFCMSIMSLVMDYQGLYLHMRAGGFYNPSVMHEAGLLCIFLPIMLVAILGGLGDRYNWIIIIFFLVSCMALICNNTRGAWMGVLVAFFLICKRYVKEIRFDKKKLFGAVAITTVCSVMFFGGIVQNRWTLDVGSYSTITRIRMWTAAYNMWKDYPVFGVGFGNYEKNYRATYILKSATEGEKKFGHAHSNIMMAMAETGMLGLFGFLLCFAYILRDSYRRHQLYGDPFSLMIFSSTLALMVQGLTEYNLGNLGVMRCYWVVLGLCLVSHVNFIRQDEHEKDL